MSTYENEVPTDNSYVSRQGSKGEPLGVVSDETRIEDPIDAQTADSDQQLERDDKDAINEDNIINERTRGAKPEGSYQEPGDEEGLPADDGTSKGAY
ncbi:hypothetical protein SCUP234_07139 [Seiridium cupressi]|uniref:Histone chaperone domain-containing protein n=1 Tax=Seiridium unicorne TaxID=138068 RepID=A0ABR2UVW7_9PEZI